MSAEITAATWSARFSSSSRAASSRLARSATGVADQAGNAALAARTASSTSAGSPAGTVSMTCSVAGLMTSMPASLADGTHLPPIKLLRIRPSLRTPSNEPNLSPPTPAKPGHPRRPAEVGPSG